MKKFTLFLFVVLLGAGGYVYWNYFNVYSDGNREGVMMKVSRKGNVFKTFEAEVMQPGFRSGAGSLTSNTFKFSATDEAVSKQLEELTGKTVKVHYLQYRNALPWRGEDYGIQNAEQGQYVVDKVLEVPAALAPATPQPIPVPMPAPAQPASAK